MLYQLYSLLLFFFFFYSGIASRMSGGFCLWVYFPLGVLAFLTWVVNWGRDHDLGLSMSCFCWVKKGGGKERHASPGLAFLLPDLLPGPCLLGVGQIPELSCFWGLGSWFVTGKRQEFGACGEARTLQAAAVSCSSPQSGSAACWAFLPLMPGFLAAAVFLSCGGWAGPRCILTIFTVVLRISTFPLAAEVISRVGEQRRTPAACLRLHTSTHRAPWYFGAFCLPHPPVGKCSHLTVALQAARPCRCVSLCSAS